MKTTTILALSAATLAAAQSNSTLATCGQNCINDLIGIMQKPKYNCPNNPTCFCCQPDFGFGIRDCANQACGSNSGDANSAIAYAASYCASALPTESTSACAAFSSGASSGSGSAASASATSAASGSGASGASGSPQQTGAPGFIVALANGASGYSIGSTTATAGGPEVTASGTEYSALPSDSGIVATASGVTTTIPPSALTGGAAGASGSASSGSGSGAGPAGFIVPVNGGTSGYSIASTTITAGGPEATLSNTEYTALPSAAGVVATASGLTTTYAESQLGGAAGASGSSSGAGASPASSSGSGAAGAGGASSSATTTHASSASGGSAPSSSTSGGAGAIITAAPVMIGAAALAVLAL